MEFNDSVLVDIYGRPI